MEVAPSSRRKFVVALLAAAALYLAACLVLLLFEDRFVYHPNRHGRLWWLAPPAGLQVEEVWLHTPDGVAVHGWWCPRPGTRGAVLFCHGNAGNLSQRGRDVQAIQQELDESVLIFDYPGFGRSAGEVSEAGCYAAAAAAYDWLSPRVEPRRIIILGQSLGGGVATDLAAQHDCRALALLKTFASVPEVAANKVPFLPTGWMHNRFDNLARIGRCRAPVFIAHGECDQLIPLRQGRRLFEAAPGPKRFLLLEGCGHAGGVSRGFLRELRIFLKKLERT